MPSPMFKKILILLMFILVFLLLGFISALSTANNIDSWYITLKHPFFSPPNAVFAPTWTVLYILIGISGWLVWLKKRFSHAARNWYIAQAILNFMWTFIFFSSHQLGFALIDIVLLLLSIIMTIRYFYPINRVAAYLLIPYGLWVAFATLLNMAYWFLN